MSTEDAAIALNRFGLGARPGEIDRIAGDPRAWLTRQIGGERPVPAAISTLPSTSESVASFGRWITSIGIGQGGGEQAGRLPAGKSVEQSFKAVMGPPYMRATAARFETAVAADEPFRERWMRFWSNHFTV